MFRPHWILGITLVASVLVACGGAGGSADSGNPDVPREPEVFPAISLASGRAIYENQCELCHSVNGQGGSGPSLNSAERCPLCADFDRLWPYVDENMPFRNAGRCVGTCARDVAAYIVNEFTTEPGCSVAFEYGSIAGGQFEAAISIRNHSEKAVNGWRVDFTFPDDQLITGTSNAVVMQSGAAVVALPAHGSGFLPGPGEVVFGIAGMHGGATRVPVDLRLEAPPCFAAPP